MEEKKELIELVCLNENIEFVHTAQVFPEGNYLFCWKQYNVILHRGEILKVHSFEDNRQHFKVERGSTISCVPFFNKMSGVVGFHFLTLIN